MILRTLLQVLDRPLVELADPQADADTDITTVALLDPDDLRLGLATTRDVNLLLLVGVTDREAAAWLRRADEVAGRAVFMKNAAPSEDLLDAARERGVAVVKVHPNARWEHLYSLIRRVMAEQAPRALRASEGELIPGADEDLFGLAQKVAALTGGLVTIEDERSRVLAYSASGEDADELRRLSILGREGPAEYLRWLHSWGIFEQLRLSDAVVHVDPREELGIRRRLAVGIRHVGWLADQSDTRFLGSIWVQEASSPFADNAEHLLRGAAALAARLILRATSAPDPHVLQLRRLLGSEGEVHDPATLGSILGIPTAEPTAVVGFAQVAPAEQDRVPRPPDELTSRALDFMSMHASSFNSDALTGTLGDRVFVVFPRLRGTDAMMSWARQAVDAVESELSITVRAAVASPIADLGGVADARREVDRVLDAAMIGSVGRVATLANARTTVLLGEIIEAVRSEERLHDPRLSTLRSYDAKHKTEMTASVAAYLEAFGDVRSAAGTLHVHPNSLRYRLRRAEEILGMSLADPASRLLLQIQLMAGTD